MDLVCILISAESRLYIDLNWITSIYLINWISSTYLINWISSIYLSQLDLVYILISNDLIYTWNSNGSRIYIDLNWIASVYPIYITN